MCNGKPDFKDVSDKMYRTDAALVNNGGECMKRASSLLPFPIYLSIRSHPSPDDPPVFLHSSFSPPPPSPTSFPGGSCNNRRNRFLSFPPSSSSPPRFHNDVCFKRVPNVTIQGFPLLEAMWFVSMVLFDGCLSHLTFNMKTYKVLPM